jgi:hypothetical protein
MAVSAVFHCKRKHYAIHDILTIIEYGVMRVLNCVFYATTMISDYRQ